MASREITDLLPALQSIAMEFKRRCKEAGIDILIYETYRSHKEQDANYAKGRTKAGHIITNAKGGQSKHNCVDIEGNPASHAFDAVPMKGKTCQWNDISSYEKMAVIGKELGLKWGGDFKSIKDKPHFELPY